MVEVGVASLISALRLLGGMLALALLVVPLLVVLALLLPWRWVRARLCNHAGTVIGRTIMWFSGCPITVVGREALSPDRPALYAGNHTSIYDAFLSIWLTPTGTVGVAKKQILYYPFFGLAWFLSGHLRIDRANTRGAIEALRGLGEVVRREGLHVCMWPEGRRSPDGRLLPFKKGLAHLAIQTRLPIVPMVIQGAHRAWTKGSLALRPTPIQVTFLPPVDTSSWEEARIDEHLAALEATFAAALPPEQRPLSEARQAAA